MESGATPGMSAPRARLALWFLFHLATIYLTVQFVTPWVSHWVRDWLFPLLHEPVSKSRMEFLFSYLPVFTAAPAFLAGLLNSRFNYKAAVWVWSVPAMILLYKLLNFPEAHSVFGNHYSGPFRYYFGGDFLIAEWHDWSDFGSVVASGDTVRGLAQLRYTAPLYAAIAYGAAAWTAIRFDLEVRVKEKLSRWEESRFGGAAEPPIDRSDNLE